ncbi:NAD-dependent deacylase [Kordiimonas lacus]|uniref:NAD-dependent protein deacylase n=1 Tax=Kordiimonas lacus TaxID=637679 RepID=A0A1G6XMG9_9PROT|nr:NAD-dependent deacylase [Kordiimonas lacus]SDD78615.1 NAD-dependent deacetylase [Kordiimonas lacus]
MAYQGIVILTGAGISAESGLRTFRDNGGLWEDHSIEEVATPQGFDANPSLVHKFYNQRRAQLQHALPNAAHNALARLEAEHQGDVTTITQNVDNLHEQAGSKRILHMHGELQQVRCTFCDTTHTWTQDCDDTSLCPSCGAASSLRPNIVWFGEMPFHLDQIDRALASCDLFISIGTSGNVYPAAGFVSAVRRMNRAYTVEINLEPSVGVSLFHEARHGPAGTLVPEFVDALLNKGD